MYSLKMLFVGMAMVSMIIAIFLSKSALIIELGASWIFVFLFLAAAFSFWDRELRRRPFWTGYFFAGLAMILLGATNSFSISSNKFASLFVTPDLGWPPPPIVSPDTSDGTLSSTDISKIMQHSAAVNAITVSEFEVIENLVPVYFSILTGITGGWIVTLFESRRLQRPSKKPSNFPL